MFDFEKEIRTVVGYFKTVRLALIKELTKTEVSGYKEIAAIKTEAKTNEMIKALNAKIETWARRAVGQSYLAAINRSRVSLEILGAQPARPHAEAHRDRATIVYKALVSDFERATATIKRTVSSYLYLAKRGEILTRSIQEFDETDVALIENKFAEWADQAVREGWARQKLSKMIKDYLLQTIEDGDLITINGRNFSVDYYAEMTARTRLRESQTEATKELCYEYANDLVEFSTHNQPCSICAEKEGQVYSISGTSPDFPPLTPDDEPPIHPNCEHSIAPTSQIAIEAREKFK